MARLAGDEFVIVLEGLEQPALAGAVAEKVIGAMGASFVIAGRETVLSTSVGVAVSEEDDDVETLLKRADEALYDAKRVGRGVFKFAT